MADGRYVVVAEIGLAKTRYGADIRTSEPLSLDQAQHFLQDVLDGNQPDFFDIAAGSQKLYIEAAGQHLVIEKHRLQPDRLSRFSVAKVLD